MRPFSYAVYSLVLSGGDKGNRTLDPLLAKQVLSQLSYTPVGSVQYIRDFQSQVYSTQ